MNIRLFAAMLAIAVSTVPASGADKVRIGVSNYNISNLTVGVAQTKDFFKQEGIEAEIIRMNPNVATMALVSGDIDYSTLIGSVIGANLKGAKLKMIACSQDRTPLSLVGKAAIKSVTELKGKTIGVGSYGSTPDIIARMVVKHYGVDPETEIKMLALGSDSARLTALKEGVVDAIIVAPPVEGAIQVLVNWTKTKPEFAEAAYDSTVGVFSQDGTIPEDGLRLVIENFRKSMNLSRQVSLSDVSDSTLLFQVQRDLGIKK
jgi:ABC-type nitrate/sulfonate/bicarbonate transport system substrate-binding protein